MLDRLPLLVPQRIKDVEEFFRGERPWMRPMIVGIAPGVYGHGFVVGLSGNRAQVLIRQRGVNQAIEWNVMRTPHVREVQLRLAGDEFHNHLLRRMLRDVREALRAEYGLYHRIQVLLASDVAFDAALLKEGGSLPKHYPDWALHRSNPFTSTAAGRAPSSSEDPILVMREASLSQGYLRLIHGLVYSHSVPFRRAISGFRAIPGRGEAFETSLVKGCTAFFTNRVACEYLEEALSPTQPDYSYLQLGDAIVGALGYRQAMDLYFSHEPVPRIQDQLAEYFRRWSSLVTLKP